MAAGVHGNAPQVAQGFILKGSFFWNSHTSRIFLRSRSHLVDDDQVTGLDNAREFNWYQPIHSASQDPNRALNRVRFSMGGLTLLGNGISPNAKEW